MKERSENHKLSELATLGLIKEGAELRKLGKYEEAVNCYEKVLEMNSRVEDGWIGKGLALSLLGRYIEAVACFDVALHLNPRLPQAWAVRGAVLGDDAVGIHDVAIVCYEKALEIDPSYTPAWLGKTVSFCRLGNYGEALKSFNRLVELSGPSSAESISAEREVLTCKWKQGIGIGGLYYRLVVRPLERYLKWARSLSGPAVPSLYWILEGLKKIKDSGQKYTPRSLQPLINSVLHFFAGSQTSFEALRDQTTDICYHTATLGDEKGGDEKKFIARKVQIHMNYWDIELRFPGLGEAIYTARGEDVFGIEALVTAIMNDHQIATQLKLALTNDDEHLKKLLDQPFMAVNRNDPNIIERMRDQVYASGELHKLLERLLEEYQRTSS